jgi:hypothetical protein
MHPRASSPLSEEILMLRFILLFHGLPWHEIPTPRSWTSKMSATRQAFLRQAILFARARIPSSGWDPRVRNAAIGPWIEVLSMNLVTKDGGMELG